MPLVRLLFSLWPGLLPLWLRSSSAGLVTAFVFAAGLNATLVASLIWTDWFSPAALAAAWTTLAAAAWISAWITHRRASAQQPPLSREQLQDLFCRAQCEYLQGHWFEAEVALDRILSQDEADLDARLLLATLYRQTSRPGDARRQLNELARREGDRKWRLEMARELHLLNTQSSSAITGPPEAVERSAAA